MNIHEYQAKELLRKFEVNVPNGFIAMKKDEIENALDSINTEVIAVKSQIHAGGRGAGRFKENNSLGGVIVTTDKTDAKEKALSMLGSVLVTKQTGEEGKQVNRIYFEEGTNIDREFYLSMLVDRTEKTIVLVASASGGMNIEEVAEEDPSKILKHPIDVNVGITSDIITNVADAFDLNDEAKSRLDEMIKKLYKAFTKLNMQLLEVNPLVLSKENDIVALDAKVTLDDDALFKNPELESLEDLSENNEQENLANKALLNYIKLDGDIACMVNGAGLAMATMDIISLKGGKAANFLDVGGTVTADRVAKAFEIILMDENVKCIMINIFGGIVRCDVIADGIIQAIKTVNINIPVIVRLEGTNKQKGIDTINSSSLNIIPATNLNDAADKSIEAIKG